MTTGRTLLAIAVAALLLAALVLLNRPARLPDGFRTHTTPDEICLTAPDHTQVCIERTTP